MRGSFSDIKKLLPGIILGLVFVGAFSFGLYGVNNPNSSTPNLPPTQNRDVATPSDITTDPNSAITTDPNSAQIAIPEQPALIPEPTAPVVAEPEVAPENTPLTQPNFSGEEHEKGEKNEKERKEGGKEHSDREDDDD